jgi:peroxiredoxin Q/BCP
MEAYRDQYATIFRGGRGVTVIAISRDPIDELASWARDADFPMLFASDPDGDSFRKLGVGVRESGSAGSRMVAVLDPEGRVAFTASPFREIDPTAYDELAAAVAAVAPELEQEEEVGRDGVDLALLLQRTLSPGDC